MKKQLKTLAAQMLAVLMLASMVACAAPAPEAAVPDADPTAPTEPAAEPAATEEVPGKLVIWTNLTAESQAVVLDKQFHEVADEMGIEIEMVTVSFNDMYAKLATAVESGDVPDIMHTNFAGTAYLHGQNMILPLDEIIDTIGREDFSPAYLRVLSADGAVYGLPDWAMHTSVWYRKDLFAEKGIEIPKTWDEFMAAAKALNIDTNNDGNIDVYGFPVPMNPVQVAPQTYFEMMCSAGVYFTDPATGEYYFGSHKEEAKEVLDYLVELYKQASPPSATEWSWGEYRNALVEGTVAMTLDMGAVIGNAQSNNPEMTEKLGCFDFPGPDGTKAASFGSGYCFVGSNQGSDAKTALIKEFLTKLYTPERAAERALSRPMFAFPSYYPAFEIYKAAESVALFQNEIATIFDAFENGTWYWYGMENGLSDWSSYIESTTFIGEAIQGAALGTMTTEEAVDYIDMNMQEKTE